jgi:hypothetical protein
MEVHYYQQNMNVNATALGHVPTLKLYYQQYRNYAHIINTFGDGLRVRHTRAHIYLQTT